LRPLLFRRRPEWSCFTLTKFQRLDLLQIPRW